MEAEDRIQDMVETWVSDPASYINDEKGCRQYLSKLLKQYASQPMPSDKCPYADRCTFLQQSQPEEESDENPYLLSGDELKRTEGWVYRSGPFF